MKEGFDREKRAAVESMSVEHAAKDLAGRTTFVRDENPERQQKSSVKVLRELKIRITEASSMSSSAQRVVDDYPVNMRREIQSPLMHNPNTVEDILMVIKNLCVHRKVRGFVLDTEVEREWLYIFADMGAISSILKYLDQDRKTTMFRNIRFVFPAGNEYMSEMKVIMKLARDLGYDIIGPAFNFRSPAALIRFFSGKDTHISNDFLLKVIQPVFVDELVAAWLRTSPRDSEDVYDPYAFAKDDSDLHFSSHSRLCNELLSAFHLQLTGVRRNKGDVYTLQDANMYCRSLEC
jgi:hypothetical protein